MKRFFLTLTLFVSMVGALRAQADNKAIGIRFGGGFGYGGEISYQQPLNKDHRLEVDLGLNSWGFGLNGVYQWVWNLSDLADGFNWYAGVGAGIGSYNFDYNTNRNAGHVAGLGILGQIGIEYKFEIPITLSLDYRPGIYVLNGFNPSVDGICLAARYRF
ncbi:MAG: hypothetical protein Q8904_01465 [Bacteroidota bacterium]|nr:hypothetical protein [Bacteroidota bacterium]